MPLAPTTDFSFEKDVAPYASKYFDRVSADPNLTGWQKRELQGMLLNEVDEIRQQQVKLQETAVRGRMRDLQYASGISALEEARARRARMEQASGEVAGAQNVVQSIMNSADSPEEKRRKLGEFKVNNAAALALNPDAKQVFEIGESALPKEESRMTDSQIARFAAQRVPAEVIATGDPMLIGNFAAQIAEQDRIAEEAKKLREDQSEKAMQMKLRLAQEPLKFAKDETTGTESEWLEPESTNKARLIVSALAPDELDRFEKITSDRERATFVNNIQLREQINAIRGGSGVPTPQDRAASITGFSFKKD